MCGLTSLYSLMSLVRPLSSISPKGLLVSGHLKNRGEKKPLSFQNVKQTYCVKGALLLHHADVMDKLQSERQQFVVGVCSKQTVIHDLWRKAKQGE